VLALLSAALFAPGGDAHPGHGFSSPDAPHVIAAQINRIAKFSDAHCRKNKQGEE